MFQIGDQVKVQNCSIASLNGTFGTVVLECHPYYDVEIQGIGKRVIEFDQLTDKFSVSTLQNDISDSINFAIGSLRPGSVPYHSHNWKKYIGLTYQEDYCDGCNETRNKRGLYE